MLFVPGSCRAMKVRCARSTETTGRHSSAFLRGRVVPEACDACCVCHSRVCMHQPAGSGAHCTQGALYNASCRDASHQTKRDHRRAHALAQDMASAAPR